MPMLYAPLVRVAVTQMSEAEDHWIPPTNADGVFWPFIVAIDDLRAAGPYLHRLDAALALPERELRRALVTLLRETPASEPQALLGSTSTASLLWVADAFYPRSAQSGDTAQLPG
jgi:hypothetical protein